MVKSKRRPRCESNHHYLEKEMLPKASSSPEWGQCEICGNVVILDAYDVCFRCRGQRQKEYDKVIGYLKDHRGSDVNIIAEATGVAPRLVLKLLRKGSVQVFQGAVQPKCARCGKTIDGGRYS